MATTMPNPTVLSSATRFHPTHYRAHSRSPSRSPVRAAQFRAQNLDPLLRNLSPESTLQALKATETIQGGPAQDVLTRSIADASPSEREIGIRAAFAAQKLREWRSEVSEWDWPSRQDRALGTGFLTPQRGVGGQQHDSRRAYLGYLPVHVVDQYEQRIDEIRDAMDSLEMDDIKDHVLAAHTGSSASDDTSSQSSRFGLRSSSYGRMRDFTALITATVIQALPDLAILNAMLSTWDIRIDVLRQLPMVAETMEGAGRGVQAATNTLSNSDEAASLTQSDLNEIKSLLGSRVADFGSRIDKLLDLLEGQEDALPQTWIDQLEKVELEYATWVVDAQRIVTQNESQSHDTQPPTQIAAHGTSSAADPSASTLLNQFPAVPGSSRHAAVHEPVAETSPDLEMQQIDEARSKLPPIPHDLHVPITRGHRREISDVSAADSAYSAMSGLSEAEIVEARQTQVLPSSKASVVDTPSTPVKELTMFDAREGTSERPPMYQRASTASFEVVSKEQLKTVDLRRSMSADLLAKMSPTLGSISPPSGALQTHVGRPITGTTPVAELEDPTASTHSWNRSTPSTALPSPTLEVLPLRLQTRGIASENVDSPVSPIWPTLPRRSSKRRSLPASVTFSELTPITSMESEATPPYKPSPEAMVPTVMDTAPRKDAVHPESLESKIQGILSTLPTKIRLANEGSVPESSESTRASTPTPSLTLSPAKPTKQRSVADTDVRVFHLHSHGQSKDVAPIKLFVRAVGENGERVMVRVGGGWADLGEYLKEYSAHHRSKSIADGNMEVAQYPGKGKRESIATSTPSEHTRRASGSLAKAMRRRSASQTSLDSARGGKTSSRSPSPPPARNSEQAEWVAPPVPPIPASYTINSPRFTTTSLSNGVVETKMDAQPLSPSNHPEGSVQPAHSPAMVRSSIHEGAGFKTTTTTTINANGSTKYTPLGAAGPKANVKRSATLPLSNDRDNDAWVQGMIGKARAASGTTVTQGPTTTTTTTTTLSTPPSRRASTMLLASSGKTSSPASPASPDTRVKELEMVRRKSRLSLGDVSGIRRVFLRRKSEKQ